MLNILACKPKSPALVRRVDSIHLCLQLSTCMWVCFFFFLSSFLAFWVEIINRSVFSIQYFYTVDYFCFILSCAVIRKYAFLYKFSVDFNVYLFTWISLSLSFSLFLFLSLSLSLLSLPLSLSFLYISLSFSLPLSLSFFVFLPIYIYIYCLSLSLSLYIYIYI